MSSLHTIQKLFPQVEEVVDSRKTITISVTAADGHRAKKKDPYACALAKACTRQGIAEGAIIGVGYSYLIKGRKATRFKTSVPVAREITSFDRHHDFQPGENYLLSKISPTNRLDRIRKPRKSGPHHKRVVHHTANIRILRQF